MLAGWGMARAVRYTPTRFGDIAFTEHGQGPPALFVHGVFLNGYLWRHVIDRVADLRRCIAIDLLAHGGTRASAEQTLTFDEQAEMLESFCDSRGLAEIDLVSNDSGGGIAQIFAARHPARIRSLTLTNCDTHDNWPPPAFMPVVEAARQGKFAENLRQRFEDIEVARRSFVRPYEHPEEVSNETLRIYFDPTCGTAEARNDLQRFIAAMDCSQTVAIEPMLRRLQAPTLVVWGTGDIFFDVKWAYWLRDTIPGCRRVIEVEGAKLFFPEERPDALAGPLRELWQAVSPA
jgi:pimeloyl-ACP methyl ester carboxylesterase